MLRWLIRLLGLSEAARAERDAPPKIKADIKALRDPSERARYKAISNLHWQTDERWGFWPLLEVVQRDRSDNIRCWAAATLGKVGGRRAVQPLLTLLRNSSEEIRAGAAQGLGLTGDPGVVEPLIGALEDPSWQVRAAAVVGLRKIGDPGAGDALLAALEGDPVERVRELAIQSLGKIGDRRAIGPLLALVVDTTSPHRRSACEALGDLRAREAVEPLLEWALNAEGAPLNKPNVVPGWMNPIRALALIAPEAVAQRLTRLYQEASDFGILCRIRQLIEQLGPAATSAVVEAFHDCDRKLATLPEGKGAKKARRVLEDKREYLAMTLAALVTVPGSDPLRRYEVAIASESLPPLARQLLEVIRDRKMQTNTDGSSITPGYCLPGGDELANFF